MPTKASQGFAPVSAGSSSAPVNDLSSMVKKKKVAPAPAENGSADKRKATEEQQVDESAKKAKTA